MKRWIFMLFLIGIFPSFEIVYAEQILITISDDMDKVIFDGKWSTITEWKKSSLNTFSSDVHKVQVRSAHQDNFIYFMIDFVSDTHLDSGIDKAMICLDTKNDGSLIPDGNDYCFISILEGEKPIILQGTSQLDNPLEEITTENFIAIGSISDQMDRYSEIPHSSFEFKIPTEFVGRSSQYGILIALYDGYSDTILAWPENQKSEDLFDKPKSIEWGELVSPDKTLPELDWPILSLIPVFFFVIYLTKLKSKF